MVGLLGAQDRVAIVEGALEVSEGHGPWGTLLGTEIGGAEAGTAPGMPRESGMVASIFGGMSGEAGGLQGELSLRGWVDRTYGQLAEAVLVGVPPAQLFPGKPSMSRVARLRSAPPETLPQSQPAHPSTPTNPTHIPAGLAGLKITACVGRPRVRPGAGPA